MKLLFTLSFLLISIASFSQNSEEFFNVTNSENPWIPELSSENPWNSEKSEENPWKAEKSEENPWGNYVSETELEETRDLDSSKSKINSTELKESQNQLSKLSLKDIKEKGYTEFSGKNSFALGFALSMILNFYAIVPSMLVALTPSFNETIALNNFNNDNPTATKEQKKYYKRGIKNKRAGKTALGVVLGSITQVGILLIILTTFIF
jgi:hypothetical protein